MTKEQVFAIMGKYYGNAHYRLAIAQGIRAQDLYVVRTLLDQVNALGYCFSNCHRLEETEDKRFVPLILDAFGKLEAVNYREGLLYAIRFRSYGEFVPQLLEIYETCPVQPIRVAASHSLMSIRSAKYRQEYLRIVASEDYGREHDWLLELLCKLREPVALDKLRILQKKNPKIWSYTFLKYAASFKDPSVMEDVAKYLTCDDPEKRRMAKRCMEKLEQLR